MRGEILDFDDAAGTGRISGDDGVRYRFSRANLGGAVAPHAGARVDFVASGEEATDVIVLAAATAGSSAGLAAPGAGVPVGAINWGQLFFSFEGRTRRSHFWIAWLILLGVGVVLGWLPLLGMLLSILLIWPNLAITVKRLHDMGRSGWLVLIPWVLGLGALIAGFSIVGFSLILNQAAFEAEDPAVIIGTMGPAMLLFLASIVVNLAFLLWIGLTDSQPGDNRYGPNPKGL